MAAWGTHLQEEAKMTEFLLTVLLVGPMLIVRACRPGPIPRTPRTWFDIIAGNTATRPRTRR